jgi:hypothetical protein
MQKSLSVVFEMSLELRCGRQKTTALKARFLKGDSKKSPADGASETQRASSRIQRVRFGGKRPMTRPMGRGR